MPRQFQNRSLNWLPYATRAYLTDEEFAAKKSSLLSQI